MRNMNFCFLTMWLVFFETIGVKGELRRRQKPDLPSVSRYQCNGTESVYFVSVTFKTLLDVYANPPTDVYPLWTDDAYVLGLGVAIKVGNVRSEAKPVPVLKTSQGKLAALISFQCRPRLQLQVSNPGIFIRSPAGYNCVDQPNSGWGDMVYVQQEFDPQISYVRLERVPALGDCCHMALRNVYHNQSVGKLRLGRYENQVTTLLFDGLVDNEVTSDNDFGMGLKVFKWNAQSNDWLIQGQKNKDLCKKMTCELGPGDQDAYPPFVPFTVVQSFYGPGLIPTLVVDGDCGLTAIIAEARMSLRIYNQISQ